ncbi:MAG TPA: AraC family transcriptional regulator [Bacteroidia bacterium]|nr:AraC family transcriptional regulator [Bacteroidia bacterium]
MKNKSIPTFDIYKKLESDLQFECWTLEEVPSSYNFTQPHRHNYYEIIFFNATGGIQEIDFQQYPVEKNTLHFLSPDQVHVLNLGESADGYVISFTKEFFALNPVNENALDDYPFFNQSISSPVLKFKNKEQQKIIFDWILKIKNEFNSDLEHKANVLRSYLQILLLELRRMFDPANSLSAESSAQHDLVRKYKGLIEKNFKQIKSVSEYAALLNISSGHLNDTVNHITGKTASELIHERVLLESKRMLYHSSKSIKEIAHDLNFDDPSYFAKFFKNHVSQTPDSFRQQIRKKHQ